MRSYSPASCEIDPGIEAQSVVQGRAGKVLEQVETVARIFAINMKQLFVQRNPLNQDAFWNASVEAI
jgi:hypothetical protein